MGCVGEKAAALTNTATWLRATLLHPLTDRTMLRDTELSWSSPERYDIFSEAWFDADNSQVSIQLICIKWKFSSSFFYSRCRCLEVRVSRRHMCFICMLKCHTNKWMHNISKFNIIYWTLTSTISQILILCTALYSNSIFIQINK